MQGRTGRGKRATGSPSYVRQGYEWERGQQERKKNKTSLKRVGHREKGRSGARLELLSERRFWVRKTWEHGRRDCPRFVGEEKRRTGMCARALGGENTTVWGINPWKY